jgi:hypothetical protein
MKKLLVLSVLLGLMALPMFASDITFGGDATFGFITQFKGDPLTYEEEKDLTFDVKAAIDDYNSLTFSMNGLETGTVGLDIGLVTTDVGKWLDLPVGLKVAWGYDDPNWNDFAAISSYDALSIDLSPLEYWGVDVLVSYKFFELELAMNPGAKNVGDLGYLLAGLAVKEPIAGLSAEVYYFQAGSALDAYDAGWIALDAVYAMAFGDLAVKVGPGFAYYLDDTATAFGAYRWALAATAAYKMFDFNTELGGYDGEAFAAMDAVIKVKPIDKAQLYAGLKLSFVDGTDTFQSADLGVALLMGATTAYVGYLITADGVATGDINGYFDATPDGGFYIAFDVNY